MIKILDNTKTLTQLSTDTSNGLGRINDKDNLLTEELNGIYEGEFDILQSDPHFNDINVGSILSIPTINGDQLFRVYFVGKNINGVCNVRYQHITYDLAKTPVSPFTATGAVSAKNGMLSHIIGTSPFDMTTDITNTTSTFTLDIPRTFRECLGGYEGSLLDVFRGEYEWDNLTVKMLAHRGSDNGVRIAYGKNLTDFKQEENIESVYTSVLGYAVVDEVTYLGNVYHKVQSDEPKVMIVDFSSDYEEGQTPTTSDLTDKAQTYATNHPIEVPNVNLDISFVPLWQTEEYKYIAPLERVRLGDTVHVFFEKLNVEATARVIKTVWNVNLQRYESIELGDAKANLNTVINDSVDNAVDNAMKDFDFDVGYIETELNNLADLVTNGLGLFITKDVLIDGSARIVLHNKPTVNDSDVLYYIGANGLVVSTDGGSTWNAGFNPDGSAYFNALAANIIKALQIYGSFLRFGDASSNYIDVSPYSINNVPQGVMFKGSGSIRYELQGLFSIYNVASGTNYYNSFAMNKSGSYSSNYIQLLNYDNQNSYLYANTLEMHSHYVSGSTTSNRFHVYNYSTVNGTRYLANVILLQAYDNRNYAYLQNKKPYETDRNANILSMTASSTSNNAILTNYKQNAYLEANSLLLEHSTSGGSKAQILNKGYNYDGNANEMIMQSASSGNTVEIVNRYTDGSVDNAIKMGRVNSSGQYAPTMQIYSKDDLKLASDGAVRITTGGSQDVEISADDDIHLNYSDKLYFNNYVITIENGYVRATAS